MSKARIQFNATASYQYYSLPEASSEADPLCVALSFNLQGTRFGAADICFVVDVSSSMKEAAGEGWDDVPNRFEALRRTLTWLGPLLGAEDRVAVVAFNHQAQDVSGGLVPPSQLAQVVDQIPEPSGGTHIAQGLYQANLILMNATRGDRPGAIVLLSDGNTVDEDGSLTQIGYSHMARLDFSAMGFGVDWHQEHFRAMAAHLAQRPMGFVNGRAKAEALFRETVRDQQEAVLRGVSAHGLLNTEHFEWRAARKLHPGKTGKAEVKPGRAAKFGKAAACEWQLGFGNLRGGVNHTLIMEVQPRPNLPAGDYPLGRFWLRAGEMDLTLPEDISLTVTPLRSEKLPTGSTPALTQTFPDLKLRKQYHESLVPDSTSALELALARRDETLASRLWHELVKLLERVEMHAEADLERQKLAAWLKDQKLDAAQAKVAAENTSTKTAPPSEKATRDRIEAGKVTEVDGTGPPRLITATEDPLAKKRAALEARMRGLNPRGGAQ